ncbi:hypothetical protein ACSSS7_005258 [Eimeria intestinalis]
MKRKIPVQSSRWIAFSRCSAVAAAAAPAAAGFVGREHGGASSNSLLIQRSRLTEAVVVPTFCWCCCCCCCCSSLLETFSAQLSGYGASQAIVGAVLQEYQRVKRKKAKTLQAAAAAGAAAAATGAAATDDSSIVPDDLSKWTAEDALELVSESAAEACIWSVRLNLVKGSEAPGGSRGGDVDKNVVKLATKFPGQPLVLTSALAECFLQKLQQQGMLYYNPGSGCAYHKEEASGPGSCRLQAEQLEAIRALKPIDPKALHRLEKVRDLMLFRHGGTGVAERSKLSSNVLPVDAQAIRIAVEVQGQRLPVYPVKTLQLSTTDKKGRGPFFECLLVKKGTT